MLSWQTLDIRAKSARGCYFVSLCHHADGDFYIARYCINPRDDAWGGMSQSRVCGIGRSSNLEEIKIMCNEDADLQCSK